MIRSKKEWECCCHWPVRCLPVRTERQQGCFFPHLIKIQVMRPTMTKTSDGGLLCEDVASRAMNLLAGLLFCLALLKLELLLGL